MTSPQIIADNFLFPECPRWRDGTFWFSDCHDGKVIQLSADGELLDSFSVPGKPSGLGWLPDGQMLIVSIGELCVYRRDSGGELHRHGDLSAFHRFHSNDMVVDRNGNAYVGEVGFRMGIDEPRETAVVLVRPDGSVDAAAQSLFTPNGSVISEDGKTFIVAESAANRLTAFTIASDGKLIDRRLFAEFEKADIPDGICLDAEGCVWIASPFTNSVARVSERDGIVDRITVPDNRVYACMLGGADRRDLYICCAPTHDTRKTAALRGGAIALARVAVPGSGFP